MTMRVLRAASATALAGSLTVAAGVAAATTPGGTASVHCPLGLAGTSHPAPAGGVGYTICSGRIPSFDGTPLDSDLTLPTAGGGPRPLIVMLNGWGDSKTDFEASTLAGNQTNTWHWNNLWFAAHGFAVLNFTARGFHRSCGQDPSSGYSYTTDPACKGKASWTHLADRRWETHDTQYLVGLLVDAGVADPDQIVATGDSYGGGQSWLLALSQDQVMLPNGRLVQWRSPHGVPIRLAAAVPQFPWTDLAQALVDNGHASDGYFGAPPNRSHLDPIGVMKESYVDGLYADGEASAQYAGPSDPGADLPAWYAAVSAGEPYQADSLTATALTQIRDYRSPFYLPVPPPDRQVPVFVAQGLTDPLFPAIQALQMVNRLTAADADYPVWAYLGDLGHNYAANPHPLWVSVNDDANAFLSAVLHGRQPALPRFTLTTVGCLPGQRPATFTAGRFPALADGTLTFRSQTAATVVGTGPRQGGGPEAVEVDPLVNGSLPGTTGGCRVMKTTTDPGVVAWTWTLPRGHTLLGSPVLRAAVTVTGTDTELAARLWDVDPATGRQALITRSVYRLDPAGAGGAETLAFELWPTGWYIPAGHQLKLELTAADSPTWRADNFPFRIQVNCVQLTLPYT